MRLPRWWAHFVLWTLNKKTLLWHVKMNPSTRISKKSTIVSLWNYFCGCGRSVFNVEMWHLQACQNCQISVFQTKVGIIKGLKSAAALLLSELLLLQARPFTQVPLPTMPGSTPAPRLLVLVRVGIQVRDPGGDLGRPWSQRCGSSCWASSAPVREGSLSL